MPPILFKFKKAGAACAKLVEFEDLPNWSELASKIAQVFLILPEHVGVAYIDEARDAFDLKNEQDLQAFYKLPEQPSEVIKLVVQDLKVPDPSTWSMDSSLPDLLKSADDFKLFCCILGSGRIFSVGIAGSKTVDDLKKAIKKEKEHELGHLDADALDLWQQFVPVREEVLKSSYELSEVFVDPPARNHLHIIVRVPPADQHLSKRQHFASPKDDHAAKKSRIGKEWTVNGSIHAPDARGHYYYADPADQEATISCLDRLETGSCVILMGARASGKTTRLHRLRMLLEDRGYLCFYVTFEHVVYNRSDLDFWTSFRDCLARSLSDDTLDPMESASDFLNAFHASRWNGRKIVLLLDEFSELLQAPDDILTAVLRTLRGIKNTPRQYAIHSVLACGPFSLLNLSAPRLFSPFNVGDYIQNSFLTKQQTTQLFDEFAQDRRITIQPAVIDDIWNNSDGHPAMVCLCGRAISEEAHHIKDDGTDTISIEGWHDFATSHLHDRAYGYITFQSMIRSVLDKSPAVDLFRSHFSGFPDMVALGGAEQRELANVLTAEGVLLRPSINIFEYRIAAPLVDELVRRYVIPEIYPGAPTTIPPCRRDGQLCILDVLTESLKFFDKGHLFLAASRSYKQSKVKVGGQCTTRVPRESVYDTELMRVLTNWLAKQEAYTVTGQWHLGTAGNQNKYCDIVVKKPGTPTVVLALLATGTASEVKAHIAKTPHYKRLLRADEAWVVHFTCEDTYLDRAIWQSDEELMNANINVVHFQHSLDFSSVLVAARWKNVNGEA